MLRLYIHYCDIPHCIANVSLCILHGPFYGARRYQHVMYRAILDAINNKSVLERDGIRTLSHNNYVLDVMS